LTGFNQGSDMIQLSLSVQWLGLCTSTAGGMGLTPSWGSKISHALWHSQKKKKPTALSAEWRKVWGEAGHIGVEVGRPVRELLVLS